ncbi:hypothetical protein ACLBYD_25345 [Rhodococcus sp. C26F]|uniref:hypothetical protein n=1 Tax=Rhodococcus pyridinivorans TaxID=103816 RepID=UPI0020C73A7F|nr:hypothetical protein [Rhodococcus pyridinivorans]UTM40043.1 hypothetical protein MX572_25685 [Rhodococcus pyridinivorans]
MSAPTGGPVGTSGSFGGSAGRDAADLRDSIADWIDGFDEPAEPTGNAPADGTSEDLSPGEERPDSAHGHQIDLTPALGLLLRPRGGSGRADGPGNGSGGGGTVGGGGGGRSTGGVSRSVGRVSRAAGRAGRLAVAYSTGDRETLIQAGLNYDELRSLGDPLSVGIKIVEAAFETQANSTLDDSETRDIVAGVVEWILEHPEGQAPSPEDIVRKSIEITIAEVALTEVAARIYETGATPERRRQTEQAIRDLAAEMASQASLTPTGATEQEMATAIENGVRDLGIIYGVTS